MLYRDTMMEKLFRGGNRSYVSPQTGTLRIDRSNLQLLSSENIQLSALQRQRTYTTCRHELLLSRREISNYVLSKVPHPPLVNKITSEPGTGTPSPDEYKTTIV